MKPAPPPGASAASPPPPPVVAPRAVPPVGDTAPSGRRTAVYVAGGVELAGLVLGGVMGALTLGKRGVIDDHCSSGIGASDDAACDATGLDAAESAQTTGLMSTSGFGVGLASLGAAAALYRTEPRPATEAERAAPRWLRAGVLSAGPRGAVPGARSAF